MNPEDVLNIATKAVQIYAESHPRPSSVNLTQAAEMLGVSRKTLSGRLKSGVVKLNALGQIPMSEVDRLLATTQKSHKHRASA